MTDNLPSGFREVERFDDAFGTVLISDKGTSFRIWKGSETQMLPNKRRYMPKSGNPSTK